MDAAKLEVELLNTSPSVAMKNLNASFRLYNTDGDIIIMDSNNDGKYDLNDLEYQRFDPENMLIAPATSKFGIIYEDEVEKGFEALEYIQVCAIYDGSFWIDQVKVSYLLMRGRDDIFGQKDYKKDVFFIRSPKCDFSLEIAPS